MLANALVARGFSCRFDRVEHVGHSGALVARFASEIVDRALEARAPERPARVSFKSVRPSDVEAYGVRIVRAGGDAFVDLERRGDGVHVLAASGVRAIELARGALETPVDREIPIAFEPGVARVEVRWEAAR
jgi:hypothetical protein